MKPHCATCAGFQSHKNISRQALEPWAVTSKTVRFELKGGSEIGELSGLIRGLAILVPKSLRDEEVMSPPKPLPEAAYPVVSEKRCQAPFL